MYFFFVTFFSETMTPSLFCRINITYQRSIPSLTFKLYNNHKSFSTQNTTKLKSKSNSKSKSAAKSKQKYSASLYGNTTKTTKQNRINSNNDLYSSVSASDYDKSSHPTGWNGTFHKCHALLNYSPFGVKSMMHSFNTLVTSYVCYILCFPQTLNR